MDAWVIVKFRINNISSPQDLRDTGMTFREMVEWLIQEEGLMGIAEDKFEILEVEQIGGRE